MGSLAIILASIIPLAFILPATGDAIRSALGGQMPTSAAALLYNRLKIMQPDVFKATASAENLAYSFGWSPATLFMVMAALRSIAAGKDPNYWPSTADVVASIGKKLENRIDLKQVNAFVVKVKSAFILNDEPGAFDYLWLTRKIRSNGEKLVIASMVGGAAFIGYQVYKMKTKKHTPIAITGAAE